MIKYEVVQYDVIDTQCHMSYLRQSWTQVGRGGPRQAVLDYEEARASAEAWTLPCCASHLPKMSGEPAMAAGIGLK